MKQKTQGGFTLVQLLVALTIIAICTAIVLPIVTKSRNNAKQAVTKYGESRNELSAVLDDGDWIKGRARP